MANALILIDIQNDDFTGGRWPVEQMETLADKAAKVLANTRAARDLGYEVTLVADACGPKAQRFGDTALTAPQVQSAFLGPLAMSYAKAI